MSTADCRPGPCRREALARRSRRIRWNEYANDEHEEAIGAFVEVDATAGQPGNPMQ